MQENTDRTCRKSVTPMRPLFRGYLFLVLDMLHRCSGALNSIFGMTSIVSLGKEPTPFPLDLVSRLMLRVIVKVSC
jgi:transcriptional antiterminator RfaH